MHLQKLEITGFKSFAHKTTLKFDKGITAIVGPNGSGKSNIADALRWVLGEQSLKLLRGKKSEDVIFAGSKAKARLGYAEVSLYLNNEDKKIPVDYPEVVITRKLFRDGEGEYLINKSRVRLMDVIDLLAKSGFGQKTYSVIGQGMIDQFLYAGPIERKALFEEAAGVKQYQIKRDRALRKLESTRQNLTRVKDLISELLPRVRSLKRQANKAQKKEGVEKELNEKQIKWYGYLWHDLQEKINSIEKQKTEGKSEIEKIQKELEDTKKLLEKEEVGDKDEKQKLTEYEDKLNGLQEKRNNLHKESAILEGKMQIEQERGTGVNASEVQQRITSLENTKTALSDKIKNLEIEIKKNKSILNQKQTEEGILEEKIENLRPSLREESESPFSKLQYTIKQIYLSQRALVAEITQCKDFKKLEKIKHLAANISNDLYQLMEKVRKGPQKDSETSGTENIDELVNGKEELTKAINEIQISIAKFETERGVLENNLQDIEAQRLESKRKIENIGSSSKTKTTEDLQTRKAEIEQNLNNLDEEIKDLQKKIYDIDQKEEDQKNVLFELERNFRSKQDVLTKLKDKQNLTEIEFTKLDTKREDLKEEAIEELGDIKFSNLEKSAPKEKITRDLYTEIEKLKNQIIQIGGIDPSVVKEYKECNERYEYLKNQLEDLTEASKSLKKAIEKLDVTIKEIFNKSFSRINKEFFKYFRILFKGGTAKLVLQKQIREEIVEDSLEKNGQEEQEKTQKIVEGIEIKAIPPGKRIRSLSMLSGGEKALTSIALLFAIISTNPSPFIALDEVDASLDESNSMRFSNILKSLSDKSQFIVITHNRETMRQSKILYGVTMGDDGISKLLSVKLEKAEEIVKSNN